MKPPKANTKDFEKVKVGEMIPGIIEEVQYHQEHTFKGFQGQPDTVQPAVRFKFKLDGYEHPHYTRWMKFSYHEKSNLYKKYVSKLVEGAMPDMDFDLDLLTSMKIKTVWSETKGFQSIDAIYPDGDKVKPDAKLPEIDLDEPPVDESQAEEGADAF